MDSQTSTLGWLGLAGYVLAYDVWAIANNRETLSSGFWRALSCPRKRWLVIGAWGLITKHLVTPSLLPKADPLNIIGFAVRKVTK